MERESRPAAGKVAYNVWLDAFDDGLWSDEPRPQKVRLVASEFVERQWINTRPEIINDWNQRQDSWRLPTAHEKDLAKWDIDHHCLWIGWFVPRLHRLYENRILERGQCVNNCIGRVLDRSNVSKAFKVVYKSGGTSKNKLFALYSPDENGICRAISVPGGVCSVLFFKEWRDDTVNGRTSRQKSWLRNVMSSSLAEPSIPTRKTSSEPQHNEQGRQVCYDESALSDCFVVEDQSSSWNDSDRDGSEYVFSGTESSESDNDSEPSHTSAHLKASDDESEEECDDEDIGRKLTDIGPMQQDIWNQASHIISTRNTATDNIPLSAGVARHLPRVSLRPPRSPPAATFRTTSDTQTRKRQVGQRDELASRSKRSRPSRQTSAALVKAEKGDTNDEDQVKVQNTHDSDDEVQFIREVSLAKTRKKQDAATSAAPPPSESVAFIRDFIAAGKLSRVAHLQDAVSRRLTLKPFRKHLTSTPEAESDALANNIAENEDEDTRTMLAEALAAELEEKITGVVKPPPGRQS
ncbi:hypothetical protein LX32DRAFT_715984 [Colletotrichum zoysiae]|uniref:Uncharacterized protein n=1 Tax=Colletotrichum zoysiae TaxID=1216348 RepID=A0AAD9HV84_9PEZI|nr:hypothetical protein LX32DRAFT_715984 [Colletotrichum zoysiae]